MDNNMIELLVQVAIVAALLGLGWGMGAWAERRHLGSLARREAENGKFLVTQIKTFPASRPGDSPPKMVIGEAVIATDYMKTFLAGLRRLFGGEVRSYHSLVERARREATQRVIERARSEGYNAICNLRLETADIGGNSAAKGAAMVAILASATAYHFDAGA